MFRVLGFRDVQGLGFRDVQGLGFRDVQARAASGNGESTSGGTVLPRVLVEAA